MDGRLRRLADSLAHTSLDTPRPLADLELSEKVRTALSGAFGKVKLRPAAVLVPILPADGGMSIVLTRRSDSMRNHPGQISFPGGRRDDCDASLVETALRESHEEIALPANSVEVMGYLPDYPTITGYLVTPIVGLLHSSAGKVITPDGVEATDIIHLPVERALDKTAYQRKTVSRHGIEVPIFELQHDGHRIWGATAGMLYQLCLQLLRFEKQQDKQGIA